MSPTSRRAVLLTGLSGLGGVVGAAALAGCEAGATTDSQPLSQAQAQAQATLRAFRGEHQAGVVEPPQPYAAFVAFTLHPGTHADALRRLLTIWTDDIERLVSGRGPLTDVEPELAAVTARLSVTVGVGPRVPRIAGAEVPGWLAPLPPFPQIDRLDPQWGQADLILQIGADSPTTVAHAQRRLITAVAPLADLAWVQRGFREPFEGPGVPMRNLFGQVDGTVQPDVAGADADLLWVGPSGPAWLRGGSALVIRRIAMDLDRWDTVDRVDRENAIGRRLSDGAPVTGGDLHSAPDLSAVDELGFHRIDDAAHLRRAQGRAPHERFLRRPYTYDDPPEAGATSNSGLIFAAYCADPVRQFVPVQQRLAEKDLLNLWTTPIGSAVFAILPGAREGEILGHSLLRISG